MDDDLKLRIAASIDRPLDRELAATVEKDPQAKAWAEGLKKMDAALRRWPPPVRSAAQWEDFAARLEQRLGETPSVGDDSFDPTAPPVLEGADGDVPQREQNSMADPDQNDDDDDLAGLAALTRSSHAPTSLAPPAPVKAAAPVKAGPALHDDAMDESSGIVDMKQLAEIALKQSVPPNASTLAPTKADTTGSSDAAVMAGEKPTARAALAAVPAGSNAAEAKKSAAPIDAQPRAAEPSRRGANIMLWLGPVITAAAVGGFFYFKNASERPADTASRSEATTESQSQAAAPSVAQLPATPAGTAPAEPQPPPAAAVAAVAPTPAPAPVLAQAEPVREAPGPEGAIGGAAQPAQPTAHSTAVAASDTGSSARGNEPAHHGAAHSATAVAAVSPSDERAPSAVAPPPAARPAARASGEGTAAPPPPAAPAVVAAPAPAPARVAAAPATTTASTGSGGHPRTMDDLMAAAVGPRTTATPSAAAAASNLAPGGGAAAAAPAASTELPDRPNRAQITSTMTPLTPAVRACTQGQTGVATVAMLIRNDGTVQTANVSGPFNPDANNCIAGVVRRAHFQPFTRPTVPIVYPFSIQPPRPGAQ